MFYGFVANIITSEDEWKLCLDRLRGEMSFSFFLSLEQQQIIMPIVGNVLPKSKYCHNIEVGEVKGQFVLVKP